MNTPASFPVGCGDPGVGYDLAGAAYITGIASSSSYCTPGEVIFEKSTNNGQKWSAPAVAVPPLLSGGVTDKPWLQVDDYAASPHAGALYISVTQFDSSESETEISVSHSTNGGASWTTTAVDPLQVDPSIDQFSDLAIGKDGTVYVSWLDRRNDPTNLSYEAFAAISSDGGATFPNLQIASVPSNPDNDGFKGTFMGDYTGNIWNSTGTTLYASWMDSRNGANMQDEVGGRIGAGSVPAWNISASPNVGTGSNQLNGVAAVSGTDVWAVGVYFTSGGVQQTLTEHWNGTSWSVVPSLSDGTGTVGNDLLAVAAITTNIVWTAGYEVNSSSVSQTLIEQYCY